MADIFNKKKRSEIMSRIRGKHTGPELRLVTLLNEMGMRTERHKNTLPGSPDVVLSQKKVALFVNGCFWHGHKNCPRAALPVTNKTFWSSKIRKNMRRDTTVAKKLRAMGWHVVTFWTCKRLNPQLVQSRFRRIGLQLGTPLR